MNVGGIFKVLIIIVAFVVIGGIVLNVILPNGIKGLTNAVEDQIFKATGLSFDLNGDSVAGSNKKDYTNLGGTSTGNTQNSEKTGGEVEGWE